MEALLRVSPDAPKPADLGFLTIGFVSFLLLSFMNRQVYTLRCAFFVTGPRN